MEAPLAQRLRTAGTHAHNGLAFKVLVPELWSYLLQTLICATVGAHRLSLEKRALLLGKEKGKKVCEQDEC